MRLFLSEKLSFPSNVRSSTRWGKAIIDSDCDKERGSRWIPWIISTIVWHKKLQFLLSVEMLSIWNWRLVYETTCGRVSAFLHEIIIRDLKINKSWASKRLSDEKSSQCQTKSFLVSPSHPHWFFSSPFFLSEIISFLENAINDVSKILRNVQKK